MKDINEVSEKSCFLEKKKSIDKVIKKKYVYITSIRNKREDITTDSIDIKRLIKEHYE